VKADRRPEARSQNTSPFLIEFIAAMKNPIYRRLLPLPVAAALWAVVGGLEPLAAGPYSPAAGQAGSMAIDKDDTSIMGWASGWIDYQPGAGCDETWQTPEKALGTAEGTSSEIVCLGRGGRITLTFDGVIQNGVGPDFAVFENSFADTYLEFAHVEVSSNGTDFFRFPSDSLTAAPVGAFDTIDPTDVNNLAGKYRQGFGTPFDLDDLPNDSLLNKGAIRFVRLIDVVGDGSDLDAGGDPIYDPYPTTGTAGLDLDAVAVIHGIPSAVWKTFRLPDLPEGGTEVTFRSPQYAVLPDGRLIYGQGRYQEGAMSRFRIQESMDSPKTTEIAGLEDFDPAFIAIKDGSTGLIGGGGWPVGDLYSFDPSDPGGTAYNSLAVVANYQGSHWANPGTSTEGWLVVGTNGIGSVNALSFISLDGTVNKVIVDDISSYSSGMAVAENGDTYVATFELNELLDSVYRFTADQIEQAISGTALSRVDGEFVYAFPSASALAVDALGRLWAGGFSMDDVVEVYDPSNRGSATITPEHPPITGAGSVSIQPRAFHEGGVDYIAFTARDAWDSVPDYYYGYANVSNFTIPPYTLTDWRRDKFGSDVDDPSKEASIWGDCADPDGDGWKNLFEYATDSDPTGGTPSMAPFTLLIGPGEFGLEFFRDPRIRDLDYVIEVSDTLAEDDWKEIARSSAGTMTVSSGIGAGSINEEQDGVLIKVTVTATENPANAPRKFVRLRLIH
jgi:hypothetical protein